MLKKSFITLVTLLSFTGLSSAQDLSLSDAINLAVQNNFKIKQYNEKLNQKKYDDLSSIGNFLPSISIEGGYTVLNDDMSIDLSPIREVIMTLQTGSQMELANIYNILNTGAPIPDAAKQQLQNNIYNQLDQAIPQFTETFKDKNYKSAQFVGVQPIFMGGKLLAAKKHAGAEEKASEIELKKVENEIIAETINYYASALLMQEIENTSKDVLDGINKHRRDAEKLFQQGIIPYYHLLRAEVAVAEAEINLSDYHNKYELALIALKNSLGINTEANITLTDSLAFNDFADNVEVFESQALTSQPILKLLEQKQISADQNFNIKRSDFLPQVFAFGKYELYPEYLSSLEPRWAVGVQMKLNLFNGMKKYNNLQSAKHLCSEIEFLTKDVKQNIDLWVNKAYREVINSKTRYEKLDASIALTQENLRQNAKRFQSGVGTSLEVIDAQLSYKKIKIDRAVSLYEYYKSLADLYLAAGDPMTVLQIWNFTEN